MKSPVQFEGCALRNIIGGPMFDVAMGCYDGAEVCVGLCDGAEVWSDFLS